MSYINMYSTYQIGTRKTLFRPIRNQWQYMNLNEIGFEILRLLIIWPKIPILAFVAWVITYRMTYQACKSAGNSQSSGAAKYGPREVIQDMSTLTSCNSKHGYATGLPIWPFNWTRPVLQGEIISPTCTHPFVFVNAAENAKSAEIAART
jgi:hypothetical protein